MVATRRGAKTAPEVASAPPNTLNAPPKRGRKKAVEEAAEPAPAPAKPTKTTAVKRKARAEPEDAEPPMAKKTVATKAARTIKVQTRAAPAPAPAVRATRGRKAEEPAATEEPEAIEEAPKPTAARTRKIAAVKKAPVPKVEKPAVAPEPAVEETAKPASRAVRKAPAKKTPVSKKSEPAFVDKTVASEPAKPAPRTRKAAVPKASAPAPVIVPRATRGRNAPAVPQESPLKAPARKLTKKAAVVTKAKSEPEPAAQTVEEPVAEIIEQSVVEADEHAVMEEVEQPVVEAIEKPFADFPTYPTTPSHITAPMTSREAIAELPGYPTTPSHILAPLSNKAALTELAGYPTTPAHIAAPVAIATPEVQAEIIEQGYNDVAMSDVEEKEAVDQIEACHTSTAAESAVEATIEVPEGPQLVENPHIVEESDCQGRQTTADVSLTPDAKTQVSVQLKTPYYDATPAQRSCSEISGTPPAQIVWGVTDQEAFEELPEAYPATPAHIIAPITSKTALAELPGYPKTPAHISAPVTSKAALAELPDYPKTPAHIKAPMTPRRALAELPDYPTTPSLALEAALQEEITASVKKQTPSPIRFSTLKNDSFDLEEPSELADFTELTEASKYSEIAPTDTAVEASPFITNPTMHLAPLKLAPTFAALEPVSPKKSALRSPQKVMDAKTPKKTVAWTDVPADESDLFLYEGILQGMVFYVDVTRNGREQNFLFRGLLEDLGAKVVQDISHASLSHVLFKDGSMSTLEKCLESKGAIKCVNVGWVLDSESNKKRMDEDHYLVDLSVAKPATPLPTTTAKPFTPFKTPSKYALPPSSQCKMPSTPTSSEFDRSFNDDKENCEVGMFFDDKSPLAPRTLPVKKSSFLFSRSAIKTPSKSIFLGATPSKATLSAMKPAPQAFTTVKKRPAESSFFNSSLGPPKKLRLL
ncbi:uncharacterized protein J4E88_002008 [Alternaria novae-zelandiae]|uniref:uncharacterized protein n=1 Tax=Alternaria novae-zelandiae TaxID=430562 RepID=UPI0020C545E2|nr:uncharacterized protein J4E88_002008 [Alternaria novae-zelandiae]KAI4690537.1 hypothetical protein J4E88_002008 [Alternaria novae-zelandiae]KAI4703436.1 hypothetical protein J4E81_002315 [Alternaria sp. BMP 2799]